MHLDIDYNRTTIWTVDEIDELIDDIERAKKSKVKRDETLDNFKRIFSDIRQQNAILIVDNHAE
jgi:hypothetical protein